MFPRWGVIILPSRQIKIFFLSGLPNIWLLATSQVLHLKQTSKKERYWSSFFSGTGHTVSLPYVIILNILFHTPYPISWDKATQTRPHQISAGTRKCTVSEKEFNLKENFKFCWYMAFNSGVAFIIQSLGTTKTSFSASCWCHCFILCEGVSGFIGWGD